MAGILRILGIIGSGMAHNRMLWLVVAGFGLFPIFTHVADLPFWNDLAMRIMLLGIAAMGLNLVLGYGGMVSFGHAAFIGIGAYCVGISQYYGLMDGWFIFCLPCRLWDNRIDNWGAGTQDKWHLFHHDNAWLCTDAVFPVCFAGKFWR